MSQEQDASVLHLGASPCKTMALQPVGQPGKPAVGWTFSHVS